MLISRSRRLPCLCPALRDLKLRFDNHLARLLCRFELVQHHVIRCSTGQPMLIPARFLWSVDPAGPGEPGPTFADRLTREPNVGAGHIRFSQSVTSDLSSSSITTPLRAEDRSVLAMDVVGNPSDISSEANRLCDIPCDWEALSNRALTPAGNRTTRAFFASVFV